MIIYNLFVRDASGLLIKPRKPHPPTHGVIITTGKGVRT